MTDLEIENLIWVYIKAFVSLAQFADEGALDFTNSCKDAEGFCTHWDYNENHWASTANSDPLSLVLVRSKKLPNKLLDDNDKVSTTSLVLSRSAGWVRSFQDAIQGMKNNHTSIGGYFVGYKIRNRSLKEIDRKFILVK